MRGMRKMGNRRRQVAAYPIIVEGRPDLPGFGGDARFGITRAKSHAKYVYGTSSNACLLHKIMHVEMHWYTPGGCGDHLVRLSSPWMGATSMCGQFFSIGGTKAKTCELPRPDTVLCGRCHGEGPIFGKNQEHKITRRQAKDRLGCIASGDAL